MYDVKVSIYGNYICACVQITRAQVNGNNAQQFNKI